MRPRGAVWRGAVVALVMACRPTGALFAQDALSSADRCIAPVAYYPLDGAVVGLDSQGVPALGTYERISPDGRYVRVATGFDYRDAAPVAGMSFGARDKSMVVSLRVEQ